jgi:hypothetical protein
MLTSIEHMLLPHDTNKRLVEFLKEIRNSQDRYIFGLSLPFHDRLCYNKGYLSIETDCIPYIQGKTHCRQYPLYLNAWNHLVFIMPCNRTNKKAWCVHNIRDVMENKTDSWPYHKKRVLEWLENLQQI